MSNTKHRPPENKDPCPFGFDQIFFLNSKYSLCPCGKKNMKSLVWLDFGLCTLHFSPIHPSS